MERLLNLPCEKPEMYGPAALAFMGDCVFDMLVREMLVSRGSCPAKKLHNEAVTMVNCAAQAHAVGIIEPMLTEKEADVLRRGRNHATSHTPKNATGADYHKATGLECLFGYLYLCGNIERLRELFTAIYKD